MVTAAALSTQILSFVLLYEAALFLKARRKRPGEHDDNPVRGPSSGFGEAVPGGQRRFKLRHACRMAASEPASHAP